MKDKLDDLPIEVLETYYTIEEAQKPGRREDK